MTLWLSLALRFTWPEVGCHPLSGSGVQFATDNSYTELSGVSPFAEMRLCWEQIFVFMALFLRWVPGQLARDCFPNQAVL